ncbi:MAG: hypothetical protein AAGH78_01670 [Cyanobacteria bacterium P01_H01_bin.58]
MTGRLPQRSDAYPGIGQEVSPALFRHQRFWLKMAAYRPLLILAGIWAVLLAIAIVAYSQLLQTAEELSGGRDADISLTESTPAESSTESESSSLEALPLDKPLNQISGESSAALSSEPFTEVPEILGTSTTITALSPVSLLALVATCAFGCLVIARQLQAAPRSPQKGRSHRKADRAKQVERPTPRSTPEPKSTPKGLPKMAPYDPTQPFAKTPPPSTVAPVSSTQAQPNTSPQQATASSTTVVPEAVQHSLDWPQDSLINARDVRQQRSLSSFM